MIFEPDEFTKLQDAVRQIYKKDFLSNQDMVAKYNQSLGIKEEAKRQFESKKERDKSIGKVDVIELETGNKELKKAIRDSNRMNLNLFDDDISIKLAIDRGELDEIYNTLKDLINGEVIKPTPNNKNIRYYKDQINIIEDYFFKQDRKQNRIKRIDKNIDGIEMTDFGKKRDSVTNVIENYMMSGEDRNINKIPTEMTDFSKKRNVRETFDMTGEDRNVNIKKPKKTLRKGFPPTTPRPTTPRPTTPRPTKKGRPYKKIEGLSNNDELLRQKIDNSEFMLLGKKDYQKMDYGQLQKYLLKSDIIRDNILKIENNKLKRNKEKAYEDRYKYIQTNILRMDDLEDETAKQGAVESKSEISGNGMRKTPVKKKSKKQGKTPVKKKSNKKSLGKQEQIYYLLSQRAGNNNKLMKKRLKQNKK